MKAIDELAKKIVVLLGQYFNANLKNDEIYELLENAYILLLEILSMI